MVTRVGRTDEAANAKALVHGGGPAASPLRPHLLFHFLGHKPNLLEIAVYVLAPLQHRLVR